MKHTLAVMYPFNTNCAQNFQRLSVQKLRVQGTGQTSIKYFPAKSLEKKNT